MGDDDWDASSLLAEARAFLAWESELGSPGLPPSVPSVRLSGARIEPSVGEPAKHAPPVRSAGPEPDLAIEAPPRPPLDRAIEGLERLAAHEVHDRLA